MNPTLHGTIFVVIGAVMLIWRHSLAEAALRQNERFSGKKFNLQSYLVMDIVVGIIFVLGGLMLVTGYLTLR